MRQSMTIQQLRTQPVAASTTYRSKLSIPQPRPVKQMFMTLQNMAAVTAGGKKEEANGCVGSHVRRCVSTVEVTRRRTEVISIPATGLASASISREPPSQSAQSKS